MPAVEKLTYLALTRYAGTNNRAWPAYETLAGDVSCGRKRVIEAVNRLVECKLVEKQVRGNRTNVYLVYPPEYYCENNNTENGGVVRASLDESRVSTEHPEGGPGTPRECREDTLRVSTEHPKSTTIITKEKHSLNNNRENEEGAPLNKEKGEEGPEAIRNAFRLKGVQVGDGMIGELLKSYDLTAIMAAIRGTDFNAARNPLAVIKWILSTGSYVVPVVKKDLPPPETRPPNPKEEAQIRQMIRETRAGLLGQALQTV